MPERPLDLVRRFLVRRLSHLPGVSAAGGGPAAREAPRQPTPRPPSTPSRPRPRGGLWSGIHLRASYRLVELGEDGARLVAREHRFEDGRFEAREMEGTIDGRAAPEALRALRRAVEERVGRLFAPLAHWLPTSRRRGPGG